MVDRCNRLKNIPPRSWRLFLIVRPRGGLSSAVKEYRLESGWPPGKREGLRGLSVLQG